LGRVRIGVTQRNRISAADTNSNKNKDKVLLENRQYGIETVVTELWIYAYLFI